MYYGGRKELEDPEYKNMLSAPKDGAVAPKPSDVRNGDLISLLLAATPPYLYNMPLVPQTFFFSEMLRSFVQAKSERQTLKAHQVHRRRKRSWRDSTPPKQCSDIDKPLELTTQRSQEKCSSPTPKRSAASCDFTAENLANSSLIPEQSVASEAPGVAPPLWYPGVYPSQPPYPIDPLHFFIDLRVSAHIWDRKLATKEEETEPKTPNDSTDISDATDLSKIRHNSAFSVPLSRSTGKGPHPRSKLSVHYLMTNLNSIYQTKKDGFKTREGFNDNDQGKETKPDENEEVVEEDEDEVEKKRKRDEDLRAVIGLELVVDYVKQESDVSEDETDVISA